MIFYKYIFLPTIYVLYQVFHKKRHAFLPAFLKCSVKTHVSHAFLQDIFKILVKLHTSKLIFSKTQVEENVEMVNQFFSKNPRKAC